MDRIRFWISSESRSEFTFSAGGEEAGFSVKPAFRDKGDVKGAGEDEGDKECDGLEDITADVRLSNGEVKGDDGEEPATFLDEGETAW